MKSIGLATGLSIVMLAAPAFAPPQLLNKTITVSFTATGVAKLPQGGQTGFSTQVSHIIYVSSAGRLFVRFRASIVAAPWAAMPPPARAKAALASSVTAL
jgi:hypothetical protein